MSRPYVLGRFLRQTPNRLLKRYFTDRALLGTVDFDTPKEREIDAIQEAIIGLPEGDRQKVEADFRDIDALASERGFRAMMDEAAWHVRNNPQQYAHDHDLKQRLAHADGEHARAPSSAKKMIILDRRTEISNTAVCILHPIALPPFASRKICTWTASPLMRSIVSPLLTVYRSPLARSQRRSSKPV